MFSWFDVLIHQEHNKDLLREAERYRFLHRALTERSRRQRSYCRVLNWLGHWLVAWGCRLQERYGASASTSPLRTVDCTR